MSMLDPSPPNVGIHRRPLRTALAAVRCNTLLGRPLSIVPQRMNKNVLDEGTLRFCVFFLAESRRELSFQLVVVRGRFRMSTKMIAKGELTNPEIAFR